MPKAAVIYYPNYAPQVLKWYDSLDELKKEMWRRHGRNFPPYAFDPKWCIEPTMPKFLDDGVELWKFKLAPDAWVKEATIKWEEVSTH